MASEGSGQTGGGPHALPPRPRIGASGEAPQCSNGSRASRLIRAQRQSRRPGRFGNMGVRKPAAALGDQRPRGGHSARSHLQEGEAGGPSCREREAIRIATQGADGVHPDRGAEPDATNRKEGPHHAEYQSPAYICRGSGRRSGPEAARRAGRRPKTRAGRSQKEARHTEPPGSNGARRWKRTDGRHRGRTGMGLHILR